MSNQMLVLERDHYYLMGILWFHCRDESFLSRQTLFNILSMSQIAIDPMTLDAHLNTMRERRLIRAIHNEDGIAYAPCGGF